MTELYARSSKLHFFNEVPAMAFSVDFGNDTWQTCISLHEESNGIRIASIGARTEKLWLVKVSTTKSSTVSVSKLPLCLLEPRHSQGWTMGLRCSPPLLVWFSDAGSHCLSPWWPKSVHKVGTVEWRKWLKRGRESTRKRERDRGERERKKGLTNGLNKY